MEFLGRTSELKTLENAYNEHAGFVVVYGRRRIGKTTLIKEFLRDKPALYFLASKETERLNRRRFSRELAAHSGNALLKQADFDDWRPLFQAFADIESPQRKVLVIDELPYLVQGNPAFASILQYAYDEIFKRSGDMLVLCGSSVSMMREAALEHDSPLYGRRTAQIHLKALSFNEMSSGFEALSYEQRCELYAVTGGVPRYIELFEKERSVLSGIRKHALSTTGFLYEEPRFLLSQDTRDPLSYHSILSITTRKHRPTDIAKTLGVGSNDISPHLNALVNLGYLERRTPFNEKYPERSKNGLYYLGDSFLAFWFTYIQPFEGELEMGNTEPSLASMDASFNRTFVASVFESISRQDLARLCADGSIEFIPKRIGAYWNRKGTTEIDVCALESGGEGIIAGECKYHQRKPFAFAEYTEHVQAVELAGLDGGGNVAYALFSKTGFDEKLMHAAESDSRIVLVNQGERV